jgi:hypothetical protein
MLSEMTLDERAGICKQSAIFRVTRIAIHRRKRTRAKAGEIQIRRNVFGRKQNVVIARNASRK